VSPSPNGKGRSPSKKGRTEPAPEAAPAPSRPRHQLVPVHEVLSAQESERMLADLGTTLDHLPKILADDAGLLTDPGYAKARDEAGPQGLIGRLVRVHRPSPTAGVSVAYRVIIAGSGE
jgi:DNA-directed RNA polymerase subunit H (RpoH/RPB5)